MNGALFINKHEGVSSFGIIELLQKQWIDQHSCKRRDVPKLGHGGTLDPFATGLLVVLVGRAVKLARYFLGSTKAYEGTLRFGETTVPGDPTAPISETSPHLPESLPQLKDLAQRWIKQPYLQTPPMHSAKKKNGKPLYELARAGLEIERESKLCHLYEFEILNYESPRAQFKLRCSSGTYVRTLAQDFARILDSVALLESLHRTASGAFQVQNAWTTQQVLEATQLGKKWDELPCWVPFDQLLGGYPQVEATPEEKQALFQGKQSVLFNLLQRVQPSPYRSLTPEKEQSECIVIYCNHSLIAIARRVEEIWSIERVFT